MEMDSLSLMDDNWVVLPVELYGLMTRQKTGSFFVEKFNLVFWINLVSCGGFYGSLKFVNLSMNRFLSCS